MRQVKSGKTRKGRRGMVIKGLTCVPDLRLKKFSHYNSTKPNPDVSPGIKNPGDPPPKKGDKVTKILIPAKKQKQK